MAARQEAVFKVAQLKLSREIQTRSARLAPLSWSASWQRWSSLCLLVAATGAFGEGGGGWTSRVHKVRDSRLNLSQHSPGALSSGPPSLWQGSSPSFSPSPGPQKRWPTPGQSQAHHVHSGALMLLRCPSPAPPAPHAVTVCVLASSNGR